MRPSFLAGTHAWLQASIAVFALMVVTVVPQPASAQSLFQTIFGFLGPKKPAPQRIERIPAPRRVNPFQNQPQHQSYLPRIRARGHLRTVCVRLCDGYYFPISNTSTRRDFYRDAQACQSRCQSNTRLYYMPAAAPSIKHARDRRGFAYKDLKTAFLYRKKLSKSCTCRPEPWTVAERVRHKNYELAQPKMVAGLVEPKTIDGDTNLAPAEPQLVNQDIQPAVPAPQVVAPHIPAPGIVARRAPVPRRLAPTRVARKQPIKKPSMGLGAVFAGGLPKVKYRHRWSNPSN